ncbi:hypothetical protein J5N97_029365 [Dioscorea zingiberensis]|uniref:Neprosin PEP catalytic domain-containing protein n=1 Tax=Dioscorea zingiberensis TaxID=325984 RepID=A0A9D5C1G3_9LILI|nr:hypothetical protein J5N97_029365 [Dioscorea zingiberensis]
MANQKGEVMKKSLLWNGMFKNHSATRDEESHLVEHLALYESPMGDDKVYYGTKATLSVYGVPEIKPNQVSSACIWIANGVDGPNEHLNVITVGWTVQPELYNDKRPHLFTRWTRDGYRTGCYDMRCPGFVLANKSSMIPGSPINQISTYGGPQYDITLKVYKERVSGNWWLYYGPSGNQDKLIPIGYWPSSIFTTLMDHAVDILWGGMVVYHTKDEQSPPMGSGRFPDEGEGKAAAFSRISAVDQDGNTNEIKAFKRTLDERLGDSMAISLFTPTQRYAAGALLALALRQAQIHQTHPLGSSFPDDDDADVVPDRFSSASGSSSSSYTSSGGESDAEASLLWTHKSRGLLRPVFRFLDIDSKAWSGLEETAASSSAKHHIGAFLRIIFEEEASSESSDQVLALSKSVDAMAISLETYSPSNEATDDQEHEWQHEQHESTSTTTDRTSDMITKPSEDFERIKSQALIRRVETFDDSSGGTYDSSMSGDNLVKHQRKLAVLFELLSACVADMPEDDKKKHRHRKGYDSRHRVALRLLATWLDIKWIKVEAMEIMVACSAMAAAKEEEIQSQESESEKSKWSKWKRGGIIGAAALTGGTLLAITGGLAAPAIAAGFGALAPTLGTLVPIVGAGGFAAMASAAGSVAGSVAVAASFGAAGAGLTGTKMARRIGSIEEFEFKPIGNNHNQGRLAVGILVSGFVFEVEDFMRPWEGKEDNLERYALQWESKNLIAISTAIQDWITSRLMMGVMKQGAMMTVLGTLVTALAWPATLLSATDFIDSKWSIALDRSEKAGKLLAEVLMKGLQGYRPVTLIGFSLGARVIFKCLQQLAASGDNEGLVERVVLLGAPVSVNSEQWDSVRKMVAGRFINVYSTNDWILGVTFRASLLTQGLAGIQAVNFPGIENVDVTDFIEGHSSYLWAVQQILQQLELDTYYPVFLSPPAETK